MSVRFPVRHSTPSIRSTDLLREMLSGIHAFGPHSNDPGETPPRSNTLPDDSEQILREAFDRVSDCAGNQQLKAAETDCNWISSVVDSFLDCAVPGDGACVEQEFVRLTRALDHLVGAQNREVFLLHGLGLTYAEMGGQLNMSIPAVEEHVARTLAVLSLSSVCSHG
jgi:DNA-directed RNA polymerase specialized sigma24 family protein